MELLVPALDGGADARDSAEDGGGAVEVDAVRDDVTGRESLPLLIGAE